MCRKVLLALCFFCCAGAEPFSVAAPESVEAHRMVRVKALNVPPAAAVVWEVTPDDLADVEERGVELLFTGPPGLYTVKATVLELKAGKTVATRFRKQVRIGKPAEPPGKKLPAADPERASMRIKIGQGGCTATPIHPRRADGTWDLLTACHCTTKVGETGAMYLADGSQVLFRVLVRDPVCDVAWLRTTADTLDDLPYAKLSEDIPPPGTAVVHWGWGIDKPHNRETGAVLGPPTKDGQLVFKLSVSPGDSGCGIFNLATGELLATTCCTTSLAHTGTVYGGSCVRAAELRPK